MSLLRRFTVARPRCAGKFSLRCASSIETPFVYVNQVGGQDSLLFDGASLALNAAGEAIALARCFAEDMVVVDSDGLAG